ncbi:MAG: hypothetical protein ACYSUB_01690 [Planctomycetota bacterium]|jgi:hypothetical protein
MIDIAPTKVYRACLFVDEKGGTASEDMYNEYEAYDYIEPTLLQFLARFDFERDVRPFQLRYRPFNLYLCDIGGWKSEEMKQRFMESLGHVIRGRLSRVYLFWTGETWEAFCATNPDLRGHETCINACRIDWIEETEKYLQKQGD